MGYFQEAENELVLLGYLEKERINFSFRIPIGLHN